MKLLLIADNENILQHFETGANAYQYGSIIIDYLKIQNLEEIALFENKLKNHLYHLVLCITSGTFVGDFIQNENVVNAVNNYLDLPLRSDEKRFEAQDIQTPPVSMVNRTTSYFNVFLEIAKAVSITHLSAIIDLPLTRLDVKSKINYYLAYRLNKQRANYYILNYRQDFPLEYLLDLLKKLD